MLNREGQGSRQVVEKGLVAIVFAMTTACTSLSTIRPAPAGWLRETFKVKRVGRCSATECRTRFVLGVETLEVTTGVGRYAPHQIPGWDDESRIRRALSSMAQRIVRQGGLNTGLMEIGLGTQTVSGSIVAGWRMRCSLFWIDDKEIGHTRAEGDRVDKRVRRTTGMNCAAFDAIDTIKPRWLLKQGITPPRDSLAKLYDSLVAEKAVTVSQSPPIVLEQVATDMAPARIYTLRRDSTKVPLAEQLHMALRVLVNRSDRSPVAAVTLGLDIIDFAPGASPEEVRILRLVHAALSSRARIPDS